MQIKTLQKILSENLSTGEGGTYSVCSSNEVVIKSSMKVAKDQDYPLVIESTSNQVDQYGGYTGMKPKDFVEYIQRLAKECSFPLERLVLGGDHLGPNAWQGEDSHSAMEKAKVLVRDYVEAGYRKIHLDASMACKDDLENGPALSDDLVAERASELCLVSEKAWKDGGAQGEAPIYIIGTEVPVPGGSKVNEEHVEVTSTQAAKETYEITKKAFLDKGLQEAWDRVVAMVVQPGVEFSDDKIFYYQADNPKSQALSKLTHSLGLVFEAHSTDYQTKEGLKALVEDHYAILKVGPWLTYAYREALYTLAKIEEELHSYSLLQESPSNFLALIRDIINSEPKYWSKYYHGAKNEIAYKCIFSLSDRIRYYWPMEQMNSLVEKLLSNLKDMTLPYSLVSQYIPSAINQLDANEFTAKNLIHTKIKDVLEKYEYATG